MLCEVSKFLIQKVIKKIIYLKTRKKRLIEIMQFNFFPKFYNKFTIKKKKNKHFIYIFTAKKNVYHFHNVSKKVTFPRNIKKKFECAFSVKKLNWKKSYNKLS